MLPFYEDSCGLLYCGNALSVLRELPEDSAHCCITSPPYWGLRDYGVAGQLGLEPTPEEFISRLMEVFQEVRRVLRDDGTLWVNIGDSYYSDAGRDRQPTTKSGDRVPSGWTNRAAPRRVHAVRKGKDCDPKRAGAKGQPLGVCTAPGLKPKDLVGIPWMLAFALRADGWYLRSEIIWAKPNPMPESVQDRPTKAHETIFLLAKSQRYVYDVDAIRVPATLERDPEDRTPAFCHKGARGHADPRYQRTNDKHAATDPQAPGRRMVDNVARARAEGAAHDSPFGHTRNKRSVWTVATEPFPEAHFATFPQALIRPCVLAGCPEGGTILDPFSGAGTTALVAKENGRRFVGIELSPEYCKMQVKRLSQEVLPLGTANA